MNRNVDEKPKFILKNYLRQLTSVQRAISKNCMDMDLKNNSVQEKMNDIIINMYQELSILINDIENAQAKLKR